MQVLEVLEVQLLDFGFQKSWIPDFSSLVGGINKRRGYAFLLAAVLVNNAAGIECLLYLIIVAPSRVTRRQYSLRGKYSKLYKLW